MESASESPKLAVSRRDEFSDIAEAEQRAGRRLPRTLFQGILRGSGQGLTLLDNRAVYDQLLLRPRSAVTHDNYALHTTVTGIDVSLPVIAAPTSMARLIHPGGEMAIALGTHASQTIYTVGWAAGYSLEEIARASAGPLWQNVVWRMGREGVENIVERAARAGYQALVVTIDLTVKGAHGMPPVPTVNIRTALRFAPEVLVRPGWLLGFVRDGMDTSKASLPRVGVPGKWVTPTWADLAWLRQQWRGSLIIKGVLSADDASRALDVGADAIVVSNHGGKGVDGVPATLSVLPEVMAAVGGRTEVLIDGGIRRGTDVVKALALGARAVLIGQPYLFGLAVGGAAGVHRVFEVFREEIKECLAMLGCPSVHDLNPSYLRTRSGWRTPPIEEVRRTYCDEPLAGRGAGSWRS